MKKVGDRVPQILLAGYVLLFIWAAINPYDRADWWAENIPIVLLVIVFVVLTSVVIYLVVRPGRRAV